MRQKNKFTALVALAQTVSRRSIKETAINAWKVLLMLFLLLRQHCLPGVEIAF